MLNQILEPILVALGTSLAALITWLVTELVKWLKSKTNNETLVFSLRIAKKSKQSSTIC